MLFSAIGSLGDRLDSKFITAYFFPAFVAVLGTIWILVVSVGGERFAERIAELDSVEQGIGVALILLVTMMLAHMLSALARPIATFHAGRAFPGPVREWSIRGQLQARLRNRRSSIQAGREDRLYPRDPSDTQPTAFGNVLAATADYPRLIYAMDAFHWLPRLLPLLPAEFQALLRALETPMRDMLNLSLVFSYLAFLGVVVLGPVGSQELTALLLLVGGSSSVNCAIAQRSPRRLIWPVTSGWPSISIGSRFWKNCGSTSQVIWTKSAPSGNDSPSDCAKPPPPSARSIRWSSSRVEVVPPDEESRHRQHLQQPKETAACASRNELARASVKSGAIHATTLL